MSEKLKEEGMSLFRRGMYDEALARFEAAAHAFGEEDDKVGRAEALNNVGVVQRVRNDYDAAEAALQEAARLFAEAGDGNRQGQALGNLGDLSAFRGDSEAAARFYSDGAEMLAQAGDNERQAQLLRAMSLVRLRQRRIVEAVMLMEQSLAARRRPSLWQRLFLKMIRFTGRIMGGPS